MTTKADHWKGMVQYHISKRKEEIEVRMDIQEAMTNYLQSVGETEDFTLIYNDDTTTELTCNGDLFDLEQIGDFCEVFGLSLIINNRVVVENYMEDTTEILTNYLFQYGTLETIKENNQCNCTDEEDCTCSN